MMTNASVDSTMDCQCEQSIPTVLHRETNVTDMADAANESVVKTLHETDQETDDKQLERQMKNSSQAKRQREQKTDDEQLEQQVKNAFRQRRRRQRSPSLYAIALRDEFPAESYHGRIG
ncbi:unnamed protein product [Rotaria socialis]|uniref:Uncharacterized protein n=1 Tax=Rotaria socialis TaxID=392032 RepID=A0A818VQW9_9BILA|nr:unnamed protein product [Rotaria socialis]CAF4473170.1 unnamed protein product [Rotaria socialis]CAF4648575.1 unnamed protein product [Rotaria socialis]